MNPNVDRNLLIKWVETYHAMDIEDLREALLHRLKIGLVSHPTCINKEGADRVIAWCNLEIAHKTETYEDLIRPRNDSYANGEYSGYVHAMEDVISQMEHIKWSIDIRQENQAKLAGMLTAMELVENRKAE